MFKEFKEFAMKGNVVDMAVGIVIGAAFGAMVKSFVDNLLMPPLGLVLGKVDFSNLFLVLKEGITAGPYLTPGDAQKAGAVTLNYGLLLNSIVSFLIVAFAVFLLVRFINRLRREEKTEAPLPENKSCPYCLSSIPEKAVRCAHCTSVLQ